MYFKDIIGQETIKKQLIQTAIEGNVAHAQLFCESEGAGAFALALAYARYLNCKDRTEHDACGKCPSCLKYDILAHPDLYFVFPIVANKERKKDICDDYLPEWRAFLQEQTYFNLNDWLSSIEAENKQALIYAKESDEIIRKLSLKAQEATYRVLIVWLPEKMNEACSNKLLKLIEEPPHNTLFFLVSENPEMIISTIQSRSQRINVRGIQHEEMRNQLINHFGLSAEDASNVAHIANGNYIKAKETISLSEENTLFLEMFKSMMRNSWARNVKGMKESAEKFATLGRERQKNFFAYTQRLIRENFMYRFQTADLNYMNRDEALFSTKFSPFVNERNVFDLMTELEIAEQHIAQNVNAKMVFFDLSLRITVLIKR